MKPNPNERITLSDAAQLFRAAGLPRSERTLYRYFTETHVEVCPLIKTPDTNGGEVYHYRRVRLADVERLILKLSGVTA